MATLLYRLGKAGYRRWGRVIVAWVVALLAVLVAYILSALILRSKRTLATQTQVGLQA